MKEEQLRMHLERLVKQYNTTAFIPSDPISIPHLFTKKQDIEIAGLFAATLAWGQRNTIIKNSHKLMNWMDYAPHEFMINHQEQDLIPFLDFKHRTFNSTDLLYFIYFLKKYYKTNDTLETAFLTNMTKTSETIEGALVGFNSLFFMDEMAPQRTRKHVATPLRKSACKRLCMYLRWMIRQDNSGVDFGLWHQIKPSQLICPIDVHVEKVAREHHLISRKQTDWQTALELTENLKRFDPLDPAKYDFALFGLSVSR